MHTSTLSLSASAQTDGTTLTASPTTLVLGGATNMNGFMRFDLSGIPLQETFVKLLLTLTVDSVGGGTVPDSDIQAANFGAAIDNSDWGLATGAKIGSHFMNTSLRDYLQTFLLGTVAAGALSTAFSIPNMYVQETLVPVSFTISAATNATPVVATTSASHKLQDYDEVVISGGTTLTNINGTYFVKVTGYSGTTFALYADAALTVPVAGNGVYDASSATYSMTFYGKLDLVLAPHVFAAGATNVITYWGAGGTTPPSLSVVALTDYELVNENSYRPDAPAGESYTYFGIEATRGVPVKALYALDQVASTLDSNIGTIASRSNRRQRASPYKVGLGGSMAGGNVSYEVTPGVCWQLLRGGFVYNSAFDKTVANVIGDDGLTYANVYTTGFELGTNANYQTFTFFDSKGEWELHVYNGCVLDTLSLSCQLGASVDATIDVMAREIWPFDNVAQGTTNANGINAQEYVTDPNLGYDSNTQLVYVGGQITLGGVVYENVQNVDFSFNNNAHPLTGIRRKRGVRRHYLDKATASITFTMSFENEVAFRNYLAAAHKQAPYRVEKAITFESIALDFEGPLGAQCQNVRISLTQFQVTTIAMPTGNSGVITMRCTGVGKYDPATGTNVAIIITSTENHPVVYRTLNSSTNPLTVFPLDRTNGL